jgi:predicted dinucleotide-binding enzyme
MTTIGFIGSGHIGSQLARLAVAHGYDVVMSNSRGPATLTTLVDELGPHARAATPDEAAAAADLAVVTVPFRALPAVPVEPLAGKVVIDTENYYPQRDGHVTELDEQRSTVSELVQRHLPTSKVVKAFNHIIYAELTSDARPAGTLRRRGLVAISDDDEARARVAALIDEFGFDPVEVSPLSEGWRIERDTPGYVARRTADELRADLAAAERHRDS